MSKVIVYSKNHCPYCVRAKNLLNEKEVEFEEIMVDRDPKLFAELRKKSGMLTLPQIFIDDQLVGGFSELSELENQGKLDSLLN